jgi:hypothetical protein
MSTFTAEGKRIPTPSSDIILGIVFWILLTVVSVIYYYNTIKPLENRN